MLFQLTFFQVVIAKHCDLEFHSGLEDYFNTTIHVSSWVLNKTSDFFSLSRTLVIPLMIKKNIYMAIFELIWSKNINQNSNQDINTFF